MAHQEATKQGRPATPEELVEIQALSTGRPATQAELDEINLATVESLQPTFGEEAAAVGTQFLEGAAQTAAFGGELLAQIPEEVGKISPSLAAAGGIAREIGGPEGLTERLKGGLEAVGVPVGERPQTETGRFVGDVAEFAGAGAIPAAGFIAKGSKAAPVIISELTSALGGVIGGRVADDKAIGELVGSLAGAGLPTALSGLIRRGLRGDQKAAQEAFDTLQKSGVTPTVPLVAEGGGARIIASGISKIPGGNKINKAIQKANEQIRARIEDIAGTGAPRIEQTGRVVKKGIEGFTNRFKDNAEKLFNKITIADDVPVNVSNTKQVLDDISPEIAGAEGLRELLASDLVAGASKILAQVDELPFDSLRKLRTQVGRKLSSTDLIADAPRAELKRIYGALTEDLKVAADAAGLSKEFSRANKFYSAGITRVDDFLEGLTKKLPENIIPKLISSGKEGATDIRALRKSLNPDEWAQVSKTVLKRLGEETGGQADEFGKGFSSERLLTNLNNLSNEARSAFFGGVQGINANSIKELAEASAILRRTKRAGLNTSGTSIGNAQVATIAALSSAGTGNLFPAAAAILTVLGADISSRLLTSPKFTKWLVRGSKIPPSIIPSHLARLNTIAERNPEISQDINEFLSVLEQE